MTNLRVGSTVRDATAAQLPGAWSVWSQAGDGPGAFFLIPVDEAARDLGVKYAVVRAVQARSSARPDLTLIRTDPPRPDLLRQQEQPTTQEKRRA